MFHAMTEATVMAYIEVHEHWTSRLHQSSYATGKKIYSHIKDLLSNSYIDPCII